MKVTAKNVDATIQKAKGSSLAAALIYGADEGLVIERGRALIKLRAGEGVEIVKLNPAELKDDPARLSDELSSVSLFGDVRAVHCTDATDKITDLLKSLLAEGKTFGNFLLVTAGNLPAKSKLRQLFEKHPTCPALPCYQDDERGVQVLAATTFSENGITIDRDAMQYLVSHLGSDRAVSRGELEKLVLYAGDEKKLSLEDVQLLVGDSSARAMDELIQYACSGDIPRADALLQRMSEEGVQPIQVLRGFSRHLSLLHQFHDSQKKGATLESLFAKYRIFYKQEPMMRSHMQLWTPVRLQQGLARLLETERACKRTGSNPMLLCARTMMQLASLARRR